MRWDARNSTRRPHHGARRAARSRGDPRSRAAGRPEAAQSAGYASGGRLRPPDPPGHQGAACTRLSGLAGRGGSAVLQERDGPGPPRHRSAPNAAIALVLPAYRDLRRAADRAGCPHAYSGARQSGRLRVGRGGLCRDPSDHLTGPCAGQFLRYRYPAPPLERRRRGSPDRSGRRCDDRDRVEGVAERRREWGRAHAPATVRHGGAQRRPHPQ